MDSQLNKNQIAGLFYIKLGCLLFWACWFLLAFSSNLFDFAYVFYGLPGTWLFRSGNYLFLTKMLSLYNMPKVFITTLFILGMIIEGIVAILFFLSFILFMCYQRISMLTNLAFGISIGLWAIFILLEEAFIAYSYEVIHIRLFIFEMITLLILHLLPHRQHD